MTIDIEHEQMLKEVNKMETENSVMNIKFQWNIAFS